MARQMACTVQAEPVVGPPTSNRVPQAVLASVPQPNTHALGPPQISNPPAKSITLSGSTSSLTLRNRAAFRLPNSFSALVPARA